MASFLDPFLLTHVLVLVLVAIVAGLARGFSGFGAALIFMPLASRLIGPQQAAPLLLITDGLMVAPMVWSNLALARKTEVGLMALGGLVGIPLGTAILAWGDPLALRWGLAVLVALMLLLLVSGWRYTGTPRPSTTVGVGVIYGVFSGVGQIGGPPVVAYWLGGSNKPAQMRASTILLFAFGSVIAIFAYVWGGLLNLAIFKLALVLAPFFGFGLYLGSKIFGFAPAETFRRICLGLIGLSLVVSLPLWG